MKAKCPVCDYELPNPPVEVKTGNKVVKVCCEECAQTLRKQASKSLLK